MKQINKRWLALAIGLAVLLSSVAAGLGLTFAASGPYQERFTQPNAYTNVIEKGRTETKNAAGLSSARSNDNTLAEVTFAASVSYTITGKKAGVVGAAIATKAVVLNPAWQVTDSTLMTGYDLANNGEINKKSGDAAFNINDSVTAYTTAWNATVDGTVGNANYVSTASAKSQIQWSSRNTDVASVTAQGVVTINGKGVAVLLGDFTDRWGVIHTMTMLVGVDTTVGKSTLSELADAVKKGQTILDLNPNPYEDAGLGVLQSAVDAGNALLASGDPGDAQISNAIDAIENAIDGLEAKGGDGDIIIVDDSKYKPAPGPVNVYEELDDNGDSYVPPRYIYDEDGSLGEEPPTLSGDEVPAYKNGYMYYTEEEPEGSNIFYPIDPETGAVDRANPIWGGDNKKPGGGDDRKAVKSGSTWYAEDPAGSNLWKPVRTTAAGANKGTLNPDETTWIGGGGNALPTGTDNLFPLSIVHDQLVAGPFGTGDDMYYVGMGDDGRFDTSGYNNTGRPRYDVVDPRDDKLFDNGTGFDKEPPVTVVAPTEITTDATLPGGTVGTAYSTSLATDGYPITWTITSGSLPPGLSLDTNGAISGTPTTAGTYNFTVKASNTAGSQTKAMTLIIAPESIPATSVGLSKTTINPLEIGASETVTVTKNPTNTTDTLGVSSSNSGIATAVIENGNVKVTGVAAGTATITVTLGGVSNTITVTVPAAIVPPTEGGDQPANGRKLTAAQAGDTSDWIEIATNGSYSLILRVTKFQKTNGNTYEGSAAQQLINAWYYWDLLSTAPIRTKAVENNVMEKCGTIQTFGFRDNSAGRSVPKSTKPAQTEAGTKDIAFLLSFQEAALYCSSTWHDRTTNNSAESTQLAKTNWNALGDEKNAAWWLRSPGIGSSHVSYVGPSPTGFVTSAPNASTTYSFAVRPAIWVESSIFD